MQRPPVFLPGSHASRATFILAAGSFPSLCGASDNVTLTFAQASAVPLPERDTTALLLGVGLGAVALVARVFSRRRQAARQARRGPERSE